MVCRPQRGVTLIELMVAMVLGLIVAGGIVTVFLSTSSSNRAQVQMARLQEDGRFAVGRISDDLKMAGAQYCSGTGGVANTTSSGVDLDGLRTPTVLTANLNFAQNATAWGSTGYPAAPAAAYSLPSFLYMRGYQCTATTCTPTDPPTAAQGVPVMGTAVDARVVGASVLTLRYVDASRGWAIGGDSLVVENAAGNVDHVHIVPKTGEPALTGFANGELAMLADCSNAQIFQVNGNPDFVPDSNTAINFSQPRALQPQSAPRFFRMKTDFRTITYFLQVKTDDGTATGHKVGALMRCDSGEDGPCAELVRGVERLDFNYGVEDANGNTRYLTAAQVDSANSGAIPCPPQEPDALTTTGCLLACGKEHRTAYPDGRTEAAFLADGPGSRFFATSPTASTTRQTPVIVALPVSNPPTRASIRT